MRAVYGSFFLCLPIARLALVKEPVNQKNILNREDMFNWLDGRFNYASISCAARVLASNKGSKSSSSILHHQKDSYMLNLCCLPEKYVVIELCQDIRIDTLVLANLEFFSSTFKDFSLFVAKRLPAVLGPATLASGSAWRHVADFAAENSRREQIFQVFGMNSYARYLKIEFRSHYGNEYYCPVTFLKVYGKTMMEDYEESALVGSAVPPPAIPMGNPPPTTEEVTTTTMEYEGGAVTVTSEIPQSTSTADLHDFEYAINDLMELFRKSSMNALNKQKCAVPSSSETVIPTSTPIDPSSTFEHDFQENIFKTIHKRLQQLENIVKSSSHSLEADVKRLAAEMSNVKEEINLEAAFDPQSNSIIENDSSRSYRLRLVRHLEKRNEDLLKTLSEKISQESRKVDASNRIAFYLALFAGLQLLSTLVLVYYSFSGRGTKPSSDTNEKLPAISKEPTIQKSLSKEEQVVPHTIRYQSSSPTSSELLRSAKDPLLLGESEADIIDATFERSPDYQLGHHHHTPLRQSLDSTEVAQTDDDGEAMDKQDTQPLLHT